MYRIIFLFFFFSGFSSLVFEVLWERMLMHVFGTTSFAISTLLTAFMAGLALGSFLGGRVAHRIKRPLLAYALLEAGIGAYALVVPLLLALLPSVYGLLFERFIEDFYLFSLLRFAAVFAVLVIPTTMMGATLPIVSHWISRRERLFQGSIGLLYGSNTLGACMGCLLAGFVLLPALGQSATNLIFALVNFALAAVVIVTEIFWRHRLEPSEEDGGDLDLAIGVAREVEPLPKGLIWAVLAAFGLTGAVAMTYQVLWTRAYVIILGSSTYSFTLILTAVLVGIALGSAIISPQVKRMSRPVFWLALTQCGVAASAALSYFVLDRLPEWLFGRMRDTIDSPMEVYAFNFFLVALVVLIPSALQGMSFPLVVRAVVSDRERSGSDVGNAYAFNTAGSIVGSFAGGFLLMPWLGLQGAIAFAIGVNLVVALVLAVLEISQKRTAPRVVALTVAASIAASMVLFAPQIDRVRLTAGMFRTYWARELFTPEKFERDNPTLLYYADGLTATTSVERRGGLVTLKANGKPEASDGADMATQVLVGLMPFVVRSGHPDVTIGEETSVMVGYGSGVTAGGSLQWPLKELEVIEIEGTMVGASRFFDHVNHQPLEDERTKLIESDGRNYLEYTPRTYDVIVSEPSNPWIAGVSSLFTVEHFEKVRSKLNPGGVFAQWVQLYEMRPQNVKRVFATILEVFPYVHAFSSMPKGTDLILIASNEPIPLPPEGYERAWAIDSVREELQRVGVHQIHDLYGLMFMSQAEMEAFAEGGELNTDDNGLLEFAAPKDLIFYWVGQKYFSEHYFRKGIYGDARPYLAGWPDGEAWTPERVGRLARAEWVAGKAPLVREMLAEAGYATIEALPEPLAVPLDALEEVHLVQHAAGLDRGQSLLHTWPFEDTELQSLILEAVVGGKVTTTMAYLEGQEKPARDGYSGEKGLFYAYLLAEGRYYRHALRQIERLREEGDRQIVESLPFLLVEGYVLEKRLRLQQSFEAYLEAGRQLAGAE